MGIHTPRLVLQYFIGALVIAAFSSVVLTEIYSVGQHRVLTVNEGSVLDQYLEDAAAAVAGASSTAAAGAVSTTHHHDCFAHNSKEWLTSPRLGNLADDDDLMTASGYATQMILGAPSMLAPRSSSQRRVGGMSSQHLLKQSLCHAQSRFVNESEYDRHDAKSVRLWMVRLAYMGIHYHQHRHAIAEATSRFGSDKEKTCDAEMAQYEIGPFDYECRDTKYLVTSLAGVGLGANIRSGAVTALLMGLVTNRTVLFVNNAPVGNQYLKSPWITSCPRHDHQCFFMPISSCTPSHADLHNVTIMPPKDFRMLVKQGDLANQYDEKVIMYLSSFQPVGRLPPKAGELLSTYAHELIKAVPHDDPRLPVMQKAAASFTRPEMNELKDPNIAARPVVYEYTAIWSHVNHALGLYATRPNFQKARELDTILAEIVPPDFDPETSIGLPIRASDKCRSESECLSFYDHMRAVTGSWTAHATSTMNGTDGVSDPVVIFTTESKSVVNDQQSFISDPATLGNFPLQLSRLSNTRDVLPDTGKLQRRHGVDADEAMLSAVTSLKLQLLARVSLGNCCSNFHTMLNDFLREGCGAASDNTFLCLQESEDPTLRVCCGWRPQCKEQKQIDIEAMLTAGNVSLSLSDATMMSGVSSTSS